MEVDDHHQEEVYFVTDEEVVISEISDEIESDKNNSDIFDRKLNVSVSTEGSGIRTIVLHVPKDIKWRRRRRFPDWEDPPPMNGKCFAMKCWH